MTGEVADKKEEMESKEVTKAKEIIKSLKPTAVTRAARRSKSLPLHHHVLDGTSILSNIIEYSSNDMDKEIGNNSSGLDLNKDLLEQQDNCPNDNAKKLSGLEIDNKSNKLDDKKINSESPSPSPSSSSSSSSTNMTSSTIIPIDILSITNIFPRIRMLMLFFHAFAIFFIKIITCLRNRLSKEESSKDYDKDIENNSSSLEINKDLPK
ncbi:hypothetical protein DFJ63DRAFT_337308 [Scheffersomyces coipomensis]|uniref:uncharacterized protein n=1 Tax=Scheffersomyces coipomensis TaxID=1788519 RepID=UPI00315CC7DF